MASTSTGEKAKWREGDSCLAPNPRDGTLQEATIQRLESNFHSNDSTAWVIFTDQNKDAEKEEEEDEEIAIPVSKLSRPDLNNFNQEKPVFPSIITDTRLCVSLELSEADGHRVPYTINRYLRDYQREGIRFIYNSYICSRGCILGDDMGLGKTVQVIGFLAAVLHKTGTWEDMKRNRPQFLQSQIPSTHSKPNKVFLIVAPLSVLYNWKDELDAWGYFQAVVVHGLRKEEELARIKKGRIEIALTTYETLRLCLDQFNNIDWSAVVVDEAHKIKNPNSQITQAMKELICKIRIGLTGTILQNNLEELWCVMDWARPGCLGSLGHFKNKFSDPVEHGQRHSATKRALATGRKAVRALVRKISHCFLRRTKSLIRDQLPKKNDRVVYCSLTDFQQTVYQTVLDTEDVTLLLRSSEKCDCGSRRTRRRCCYATNSDGVQMRDLYFSYLAILRKIANHVALLQSTAGTSKKQEKYLTAICQKVFQKFPDFVQRCKDEAFEALSDPMYSGKMKVLQRLLKYYLQKRDKVLLFSLSTKLLDVLESYCMAEGLDYSRLDGTTKSKERLQIVKEFNSSSHINLCLVSTMAGGLGLNFVGANVVVLFDPTWNPANDLQAIDRAYRIGQCRDVTVLRLISLGTVEEVIYLRQVYKQQLQSSVVEKASSRRYFEAVQGHGVHKGELFGINNLFRLQIQGTCLTRKILQREGQMEAGVMTTSTHTGEEKAEARKGVSEPGDSALNCEAIKENRDASKVSRGLLDFSSGSEEDGDGQLFQRKVSSSSAEDGNRGGNAAIGAGQMNLLQHGFSRFLERVKGTPEVKGDSSSDEEILSDTGAGIPEKLETNDCMYKSSKTENGSDCLPKVGTKPLNVSRDADRDDEDNGARTRQENDEAVKKRQGLKGWKDKKKAIDWESDENSSNKPKTTGHCFEGYSEESEDFDLEKIACSKKGALNSQRKGQDRGRDTFEFNEVKRKRQTTSARNQARSKYTESTETYTSSEDEHTPKKKGSFTGGHFTSPRTEQSRVDGKISASMKSPTSQGKDGTIDSVLGGVQEVAYTHSNQRVVGGSKAEELISRAAVRDVFERKMYSQLPANQLLGTQESLSSSPPDSPPYSANVRVERPSVDHPVTFTGKSVHHTRHTTVIIGETPQAVCRQHLEEMANKFNFPSVRQFAVDVLRRDSSQRLGWLRQYYTSLNQPDLANIVAKNFPQSDSAPTSSTSTAATSSTATRTAISCTETRTRTPQKEFSNTPQKRKYTKKSREPKTDPEIPQNNVSAPQKKSRLCQNDIPDPQRNPKNPQRNVLEPQKTQKVSQQNVLEPLGNITSHESEEQEETVSSAKGHRRTKRGSVSCSGAHRAGGGLGVDHAGSSGLGSGKPAAVLNRTDRDTPSSPDLSHGRSAMLSKPTAQGREREQKSSSSRTRETVQGRRENSQSASPPQQAPSALSNHSLLTDLIGDTSILDDLFKPKPRGAQQRGPPKTPPPMLSGSGNACLTSPSSSRIALSSDSASTRPSPGALVQVTRGSRKDFWDILNEGNEESINRLTDLAEVQRVCVNTKLSARSRSGEEEESKSLWKTNEKFLWKK
nr:DNA excision repair protein ERCC-6-like 2 isoform X1 [Solea senegalensis]